MATNIDQAGAPFARERVNALLARALAQPLVVVHAGAGFGKTQAVSQFLAQSGHRTVWFGFSALDNIPARFWEHLIVTFSQHRPNLADAMRQMGFPETLQTFDSFLTVFSAELYRDDQFVVFVFDDIHIITEPLVKNFLMSLVDARLENSSVIFITRQWPWNNAATNISIAYIDSEDLRFTREEAEQWLQEAGGAAQAELANIHEYVAGWPIALSLIAHRLRQGKAPTAPGLLSNTKPKLFMLFEQEIFSQYTPAEQCLLIQLSALESFPRGLVNAVTGEQERDISQLLNGNIFIQYDADDHRFYFHPLYQEYLREKLFAADRQAMEQTYMKAGRWCRENGHLYDAANYFKRSNHSEEVWNTLMLFGAGRHTKVEAEFLIDQIVQLPDAFQRKNPMTRIVLAMLLVNNLQFDQAQKLISQVRRELESSERSTERDALLGECYTAQGLILLAMERNGFEVCFEKAAVLLPQGSRRWGSELALVDVGPALNLQSALPGELEKSLLCYEKGAPYLHQVLHGAGCGVLELARGEAAYFTGDMRSAEGLLHRALYTASDADQFDIMGNAIFMLLRVYALQGEINKFYKTVALLESREKNIPAALGIWDVAKAWFYIELEEFDNVAPWIVGGATDTRPPISTDRVSIVRTRYLIAARRVPEALALIRSVSERKGSIIMQLHIEMMRAVGLYMLDDYAKAIRALQTAYSLAAGNKLDTPFIEYGHRTRALLARAIESEGHEIPAEWLRRVHAKASTYAKRHANAVRHHKQQVAGKKSDFDLTEREKQLLVNLSQGFTREELGREMGLSVNTVKSMIKQVFAKLGAVNSADAVRIAAANDLL